MHEILITPLDHLAAAVMIASDGLALALFIGLTLFMSMGAIAQKSNTVGMLIAFVLVIVTAIAGVISLLSPTPDNQPPPYTGDYIAAAFAIAVSATAILLLLVLVVVLAIPAIAGRRQLVTSWPHQAELMFEPYERAAGKTGGMAWAAGLGLGLAAFAIIGIINVIIEPQSKDLTKGMNMSNVSKKTAAAPAPAPTPDK
jgi:hypothetical protein